MYECVDDLVRKWYKDYKGYKGVNRAESVGECLPAVSAGGLCNRPALCSQADVNYQ